MKDKKSKDINIRNSYRKIVVISSLLSLSILAYLFFATIVGRKISIILIPLLFLAAIYSYLKKVPWAVVLINVICNLFIFGYFLWAFPSSHEIIISEQSCLDVCLGAGLLFHAVKVYSVFSIATSIYLVLVTLSNNGKIRETLYRALLIILSLFSAVVFYFFLVTF